MIMSSASWSWIRRRVSSPDRASSNWQPAGFNTSSEEPPHAVFIFDDQERGACMASYPAARSPRMSEDVTL